jgi:hypothetical protein
MCVYRSPVACYFASLLRAHVQLPGLPPAADPDLELLPKFSQLVQRVGIDMIRSSEGVYREPDVLNVSLYLDVLSLSSSGSNAYL